MIENTERMGCGECGHQEFAIYKAEKVLAVECLKCKSVSVITVSTPELIIDWGEHWGATGDGILCVLAG